MVIKQLLLIIVSIISGFSLAKEDTICDGDDKPISCGDMDCCAIQAATGSSKSGIYMIYPHIENPTLPLKVFCDMETDGGGWTVFQRREQNSGPFENFHRNHSAYEQGFGKLGRSHWLGLKYLPLLTSSWEQSLRIEMTNAEGELKVAEYKSFHIDIAPKYRLTVAAYSGNATNAMAPWNATATADLNGMGFTTYDLNMAGNGNNCASLGNGGFWYKSCGYVWLNSRYESNEKITYTGIRWGYNSKENLIKTEMKIRNRNFPDGCNYKSPPTPPQKISKTSTANYFTTTSTQISIQVPGSQNITDFNKTNSL